MKKNKERAKYESPQTTETIVSLESGICAASADVQNPSGDNGQIEEQQKTKILISILMIKIGTKLNNNKKIIVYEDE